MGLFTELKRRNVFRVAATYLVSSWLLIEVGNTLEETLHLPEWADSLLAFFLIIGFPIALFVSWAYEITPEGIKREKDVEVDASSRSATARKLNQLTVTIMALALAYFAVDKWVFTDEAPAPAQTPSAAMQSPTDTTSPSASEQDSPAEETPSVAVLPFVNMSPDPDNEYFSDGISEELLNLLVQVEGLRVPSRTSSFAFKGMNTDIRDIARELQVGHILEGSVRKAGNRVRVTAQLIDVSTDTHLWSDTYDRELEDIFAIQDEIASHIVGELKLALATDSTKPDRTDNLEAYNLYLQGRHLFQQRGEALRQAETLLLRAVEIDPNFAEAWAVLAMTYITMPNYLGMDWRETNSQALEAAQRALEIQPGMAEGSLALAQIASREQRWNDSLELYEAVLASHPRNSLANLWYGITLLETGYVSQALEPLGRAVELDPVAAINLDWLGRSLVMSGHYPEGVKNAERGLKLGRPGSGMAVLFYGLETGDLIGAEDIISGNEELKTFTTTQVMVLQAARGLIGQEEVLNRVSALEQAGRLRSAKYLKFMHYAMIEDAESLLTALREVHQFDDTNVTQLWWKHNQWIRRHPLMKGFVAEFGLLDLWRTRGWPALCRPIGEDDFECD
jgi:TolB-like protein